MASRKKSPGVDQRQLGFEAMWVQPAAEQPKAPPVEPTLSFEEVFGKPSEAAASGPVNLSELFEDSAPSVGAPDDSSGGSPRSTDLFGETVETNAPRTRESDERLPRHRSEEPLGAPGEKLPGEGTSPRTDLFGETAHTSPPRTGFSDERTPRETHSELLGTSREDDPLRHEDPRFADAPVETKAPRAGASGERSPVAELLADHAQGASPSTSTDLPGGTVRELFPRAPSQDPPNPFVSPAPVASPPLAPVIPLRPLAPAAPEPPPLEEALEPSDELHLPEGLRLEQNLALLAGAGAGKTYSLVTMCLHLLSGARAGFEPIACAELGLLTFTDKAAGEMRSRLRERLDALAHGTGAEPDLRASFEAIERDFPKPKFWRQVRDELGAATIGTFHSLCTQLLRRAPPSSQLNPNFELLDEREARRLMREVVERVLMRRVQDGHPEVRALIAELGFGGSANTSGLIDALVPVFTRIREEGLSPQFVPVADAAALRRQFDAALAGLRLATRQAYATAKKHRDRLDQFAGLVESLTFETLTEQLTGLRTSISRLHTKPFDDLQRYVRAYERKHGDSHLNLALLHGACVMAPHEAAIREVLTEVAWEHRQLLERLGALDFTGLLVNARDLLRDSLDARREAQARFKALLVDEFQDTNRLQLELVLLLSERRDGAPRPVSTAFETQHDELARLPLEPAFTAVVGDRKQAIYEFRGADVSVFEAMARCLERNGGGRAYLRQSRRSTPALVGALNTTMARLLSAEKYASPPRDFEVLYVPAQDDLVPVREGQTVSHPYLRLELPPREGKPLDAERQRQADAEALARWTAELLSRRQTQLVPRGDAAPRPVRGGDVAMLFQRFTQLEVYRQALVQHGVRHRVVRGRGFFGAQEIVDVASVLRLLADPDDAIAFAAVLRSPFVGLSDGALVELALPGASRPGLHPREVLEGTRRPATASPPELARLERLIATWAHLSAERDRLGLRALVRLALDGTAYRVAVAAGPFGEQALANLDKLLELATARERSGTALTAFALELLELSEAAPTESQGEVVDELDADAVTLCTVHQAKGLEWPIVVLPDLCASPMAYSAPVRFDRDAGLGVKPLSSDDGALQSLSLERITELRAARGRAERLRLLYVAMTRARDQVVFGLIPDSPDQGTWAAELASCFQWKDLQALAASVDASQLPHGQVAADPELPVDQARPAARALVARVRAAPPALARTALLPVTHLQEFTSCPRRFHFALQVGLSERPPSFDRPPDDAPALVADVRERGTAAHKLLELTPLEAVATALQPTLEALRRAEGLDAVAGDDVLEWVTRFWTSRFGAALPALGEARVHRELPFVLSLRGEEDFTLLLRGQIDLLVEGADGSLLVIDYKTATQPPAGLEPYRFQLGCYALAAARFAGSDFHGPVRAGISFLRDLDVEPKFLETLPGEAALEQELVAQARALTRAQVDGQWPGRPLERCQALHCGFIYRCHPPRG